MKIDAVLSSKSIAGDDFGDTDQILYLSSTEVRELCDRIDAVVLIREILRLHNIGETIVPDEAALRWTTKMAEPVRSLNTPGFVGGNFGAAGTKIINSNPSNVLRGLSRASGLTMLFDPETVRVCCVMESSIISALRTAAVSVLCMQELLPQPLRFLAVVGIGSIGKAHLNLALKTFPTLEQVVLFDANAKAAEALALQVAALLDRNLRVSAVSNVSDAIAQGEAVVFATTTTTTTTTTTGYVPYSWINPGTVLLHVSLDDLQPEVFFKADLLFVDDWNLVRNDTHRILGKLYREGKVVGPAESTEGKHVRRVDGEIGDLITGRHPGRRRNEEIVVINAFGMSIEDVGFAVRIFEAAKQFQVGTYLPL